MGTTLKEIARLANVSHTTVARVLNGSERVSPKTRERIVKIAKELGYSTNINARRLVTNRSGNIGLFFSSTSQRTSPGFFYEMMGGVNDVISGLYNLIVREMSEKTDLTTIEADRFDGILLVSQSEQDDRLIQYIRSKSIPLVVLNRDIEDTATANVLPMESEGIQAAVDYLVASGHRDIAVIQGTEGYKSSQNRLQGYFQSLHQNKLPVNAEYLARGEYTIESGGAAMKLLLALKQPPTAVVAFNDDMAVGAMRAIAEAGLCVPEDISVIGFDGNVECDYVTPALTTVDKHSREVSVKGAQKLLAITQEEDENGGKTYVETELVIKDSVKARKP